MTHMIDGVHEFFNGCVIAPVSGMTGIDLIAVEHSTDPIAIVVTKNLFSASEPSRLKTGINAWFASSSPMISGSSPLTVFVIVEQFGENGGHVQHLLFADSVFAVN